MPGKIFISYRRDDSAGHAGRVHDRLAREFGRDLLFMDVDAVALGVDFVEVLGVEVGKCNVLLAVIGPNWLDARDENGNRRLDNEHDFVRIEIAAALQRGIPVIPVLLEGTRVPKAEQLPDDLKVLARRNGLDVRHASFHSDMDRLVRGLRGPDTPHVPPSVATSVEDQTRADGRIRIDARFIHGAPGGWFKVGNGRTEWFKDLEAGPEMVVVPAGSFMMGTPYSRDTVGREKPQHEVTFSQPFAVARHAVTHGQFAAFINNTNYRLTGGAHVPKDRVFLRHDPNASWLYPGFPQDDSHPVVCVNWHDANAYTAWLAQTAGKPYRLLSEAEREYVARAGTGTPFWWGASITPAQANYNPTGEAYESAGAKSDWRRATVPVGSFQANPWGLYQVHGNVTEWCEDVAHFNYYGAPTARPGCKAAIQVSGWPVVEAGTPIRCFSPVRRATIAPPTGGASQWVFEWRGR
jgi:formylglycine-generating enzyme required for sulfatase activity